MIQGDAVIHELVVPAPVQQVFDMFTDPRLLVRWIGISAELQPRPGGRFRFEVTSGQFCEGQYVIIERPARLVFTWGGTDPGFGLPPGTSRVEVTLAPTGEDDDWTRLAYTYQVTDFISGERLVMRTAEGPCPMETTYAWQAIDDSSTRMVLRNRGNPSGFSRLTAPLMTTAIRRANRNDLRKLRDILEAH